MKSIIKFGADWCGPCKRLTPIIEQLQLNIPELQIQTVDVDESPELSRKYQIKVLPTVIVLEDGQEINRLVGLFNLKTILKLLKEPDGKSTK
jgi:thioredoxin 1